MTSASVKTGSTSVDSLDYAYTGPGTLAGRYMRRFWHPIIESKDLKPCQASPVRLMNEDFTLYRGEGRVVQLVAFRCAI